MQRRTSHFFAWLLTVNSPPSWIYRDSKSQPAFPFLPSCLPACLACLPAWKAEIVCALMQLKTEDSISRMSELPCPATGFLNVFVQLMSDKMKEQDSSKRYRNKSGHVQAEASSVDRGESPVHRRWDPLHNHTPECSQVPSAMYLSLRISPFFCPEILPFKVRWEIHSLTWLDIPLFLLSLLESTLRKLTRRPAQATVVSFTWSWVKLQSEHTDKILQTHLSCYRL